MATLTVTSVAGSSTTSKVLTYPAADAQKIFDLWAKYYWNTPVPPGAPAKPDPTNQDFTNWCAKYLADTFQSWNTRANTVVTEPPPINIS